MIENLSLHSKELDMLRYLI